MKKHTKKGQVAVEYVLLLVIVIAIAGIFQNFISVGSASAGDPCAQQNRGASGAPGGLVKYWRCLIKKIGEDTPHE